MPHISAADSERAPSRRAYPLEIENIGDDVYRLMSRGHHDVHAFMSQARADGYDWPLGMPQHLWFRAVPSKASGVATVYVEARTRRRGAFPVTYVEEAYGDDRYEVLSDLSRESARVT